ncbi:putative component of NuA3 histone acetyltransferase complex [Microbotryomycetes sp. JL221]|nr:putative component of NuA3 histone acetyltransferase complex [Microbotryomycetes sp. JL221]
MTIEEPQAKRAKLSSSNDAAAAADSTLDVATTPPSMPFSTGLLESASVSKLRQEHGASTPYKHAVIPQLFDPAFLKRARDEIVQQLSFTEKETDICDLTNLSGLPEAELKLLPTLLKLRDALYSKQFRSFLQQVTGCGPLSGTKTDMSCAEYSQGCYLLNHDDVIGTRRISFILYLPLNEPAWKPEWGGALELYPVLEADDKNPDRPNVPQAKPTKSIPPSFNQFAFFEVQPGHSFHSVEEVVVEGEVGKRGGKGARVSLSGWFHKPVKGEDGYEGDEKFAAKSSLQQLYATTLEPPTEYSIEPTLPLPTVPLSTDIDYLKQFINPVYFTADIISQLQARFVEESQLLLANFLQPQLADEIESLVRKVDAKLDKDRRSQLVNGRMTDLIPRHDQGEGDGWTIVGPPHIQRFVTLDSRTKTQDRLVTLLKQVHHVMTSEPFRNLLQSLTNLLCLSHTCHVRRFRPGLDYTLARGEPLSSGEEDEVEGEAKLDVGLGLTPKPRDERDDELWESGDVGGWDLWLVSEEGGDEATYGGGNKSKNESEQAQQQREGEEDQAQDEEEDDGPLLAFRPDWNQLSLVLRDPGVMKFVKYLSSRAPGSRWDVAGEWQIAMVEAEDDDE